MGTLAYDGLVVTTRTEASASTSVLPAYLEQVLTAKLRQVEPDAIPVMDKPRPHRATDVGGLSARPRIGLLYQPRSSPEFNPVEQA